MTDYPEHEKLERIQAQSQVIGEFLDYGLSDQGIVLARYHRYGGDELVPAMTSIEKILAIYFGIDLKVIEEEKQQMLEELRGHAEKRQKEDEIAVWLETRQ